MFLFTIKSLTRVVMKVNYFQNYLKNLSTEFEQGSKNYMSTIVNPHAKFFENIFSRLDIASDFIKNY